MPPTPSTPSASPVPPVPPTPSTSDSGAWTDGAAGAVAGAGAAGGTAGTGGIAGMAGAQPTAPPPLTPPGPPLNPPGAGSVYGRGANRLNLLGYLSIVFGVIGTGCCCCPWLNGAPFVGGIPAIILGILHLSRVKKGQATQKWLGWLGIILGVLALVGGIVELTTNLDTRLTDDYNRQFGNM